MRLTVLGSSGTFPTSTNPASSYLVRSGDTSIWCDAGPGGFQALASVMDPAGLDAIVISHRHPDHCTDFFAAFHAFTYGPRPVREMPLLAPQSVIDHLLAFIGADDDHVIHSTFEIRPLEPADTASIGAITMRAVEMDHSVPTLGFGFDSDGRSMFYTADTGPGGTWAQHVGRVDLMVSEASFQGTGDAAAQVQHLTAGLAGRIASDVGATRLLLTHIPPYLDPLQSVREAESTFGRTVMAAVPGATYEV